MPKIVRLLLALMLALTLGRPAAALADPDEPRSPGERIIISGGVSLHLWEKWKTQPHDNWWLNFIRAGEIRIQQIQAADPNAQITWLIYRPAYQRRSSQENSNLSNAISGLASNLHVKLMWFDSTSQLINYLNAGQPRDRVKINNLEYFGHSNKACWLFDYSNQIDSASKVWLHETEFGKIRRGVFTPDALVRSWGCHTGESMSQRFRSATGVPMWGFVGKSQYLTHELPVAATTTGRWTR